MLPVSRFTSVFDATTLLDSSQDDLLLLPIRFFQQDRSRTGENFILPALTFLVKGFSDQFQTRFRLSEAPVPERVIYF